VRRALLLFAIAECACGRSGGSYNPYTPKPVDPASVQRACAMEVSCLAPPPLSAAGSCVAQFEYGLATGFGLLFGPSADDLARYVDCANKSSNCADALDCASNHHGPDWCAANRNIGCDGNTLIECTAGWGLTQTDCAAVGMHCATANGNSSCSDGKSCDPSAVTTHCDGNRVIECKSSTRLESSFDCGVFFAGGKCIQTGSGTTGCFPPGSASCPSMAETVRCDGTAGVICELGLERRVECAQFASHCAIDSSGNFNCVPDAGSCNESTPDTCVGGAIQMCVNGSSAQTSCSSIGLSSCQQSSGGVKCQ
jgi:hypothetical protein